MVDSNIISRALSRYLNQNYNYVVPNFFVGMYEFDMFCLNTRSKYFTEYEIKITKADFKKDFKKGNRQINFEKSNGYADRHYIYSSKHGNFSNGKIDKWTPNKFCFVVPFGLIARDEIPDYAGLMIYDENRDSVSYIKSGKFIHRNEAPDEIYRMLLDKCYWRYKHNLWELNSARHELNNLYKKNL